ncbi:MAG: 1,4-dihydroxy-2-naphthoate polyprenyltransferase [Myxococcaceae bacterium]|nr:1,4-dihydroxy-2-naphthoate polyprenyltransferase [Myxococcaceae bacterium]
MAAGRAAPASSQVAPTGVGWSGGAGVAPRSVGAWLLATRPKTLAAGAIPVAVGTALAFGCGMGRVGPAIAALIGALLIQVGTNLTNDYYDFKKGADTADRLGPLRAAQAGLLPPRAVLAGALVSFGCAFAVGMYLVAVSGWPILVVGIVSLIAGYAYTGGPFPLAYHGLGDLFVIVFFGLVAVAGTFFVQAQTVTPLAIWAGVPVGALATALLAVNNLRDAVTDAKANKRTLVVRFGTAFGRAECFVMYGIAFATPVLLLATGFVRWPVLIALLAAPLAVGPLRLVAKESGAVLNRALGGTARVIVVFGLLFAVGLYFGAGA